MNPRWIVIGRVRLNHFVQLLNAGYPGGLLLSWRGRVDWCQPCEFLDWKSLLFYVDRRLALSGLAREAVASAWPRSRDGEFQLWVLVRRHANTFWEDRKRRRGRRLAVGFTGPMVSEVPA